MTKYQVLFGYILILSMLGFVTFLLLYDYTRPMDDEEKWIHITIEEARSWEKSSYESFVVHEVYGVIVSSDLAYTRYTYSFELENGEVISHTGIMKISLAEGILFTYREVDRDIPGLEAYFNEYDTHIQSDAYTFSLSQSDILIFLSKTRPNQRMLKS